MHPAMLSYFRSLVSGILAMCCVALVGCDQVSSSKKPPVAAPAERQVYALGRLEPADGIVSISAIPGERLKQLDPDVVENGLSPANGILGVLASYDIGRTQLAALVKKAQLSDLKRGHEVQMAKAQLAQAEAGLAQAQAEQKKLGLQSGKLNALEVARQLAQEEHQQLLQLRETDPHLVTEHQLAKQANEMEMANQEFTIANEGYGSAKEAADKAVTAAYANIEVAKMTLAQLGEGFDKQAIEQEIMVAQETLKRSILLAPNVSAESLENVMDIECVKNCEPNRPDSYGPYTVLKVFLRPGEFITQTPIMQLGDLSKMVCIAEVYEADVKELAVGQEVTIRSPAFSDDFADGPFDAKTNKRSGGIKGRVVRIGSLIASPGLANRNPLAPADRSVVEVRIELTDPAAVKHAAKRVGLQVTVEFGEKPDDAAAL